MDGWMDGWMDVMNENIFTWLLILIEVNIYNYIHSVSKVHPDITPTVRLWGSYY
jgi:hypothetical protein